MDGNNIWASDLGKRVLNNALASAREGGIREAAAVIHQMGYTEGVRKIMALLEVPERETPAPQPARPMVLADLYTNSPQHMRDGDLWPEKAAAPPFIKFGATQS